MRKSNKMVTMKVLLQFNCDIAEMHSIVLSKVTLTDKQDKIIRADTDQIAEKKNSKQQFCFK